MQVFLTRHYFLFVDFLKDDFLRAGCVLAVYVVAIVRFQFQALGRCPPPMSKCARIQRNYKLPKVHETQYPRGVSRAGAMEHGGVYFLAGQLLQKFEIIFIVISFEGWSSNGLAKYTNLTLQT
jgi:hypothetical protein